MWRVPPGVVFAESATPGSSVATASLSVERGGEEAIATKSHATKSAGVHVSALPGTVTREGRVASALARVAAQCECARLGQSQAHDGLAAHVDARGVVVMCKPQAVALSLQLTSASASKSI